MDRRGGRRRGRGRRRARSDLDALALEELADVCEALVDGLLAGFFGGRGIALRGCHPRDLIEHALAHRHEGMDYAARWSPLKTEAQLDRYLRAYVNALTVEARPRGR